MRTLIFAIFFWDIDYDGEWYDVWAVGGQEKLKYIWEMNLTEIGENKVLSIAKLFSKGWSLRGFYLNFTTNEYKMELYSKKSGDYMQFILQ